LWYKICDIFEEINRAKLRKLMVDKMPADIQNRLTHKCMEVKIMKKLVLFAVLPLLIAAGCTTQYQARSPYDDVYYSSRDVPAAPNTKVVVKQAQEPANADYAPTSPQEVTQQENQPADVKSSDNYTQSGGDTYINNNYYDDYYDYAYASRLRRFHSNYYFPSSYNDFYTNMYWYDYNPWNWGTSIYFNSGWFGPSFGMSFGWGWPYYSYGLGGYPYYGGYGNGYYDGYYNGLYNGYYGGIGHSGWYYNEGSWYSNDNNYYYGHRGQSGFANGSSNGRNALGSGSQVQSRTVKQAANISPDLNGRNAASRTENTSGINARVNNNQVSRESAPASGRNTDPAAVNSRMQLNPTRIAPRENATLKQSTPQGRGRYIAPSQDVVPGSNTQGRQVNTQPRYTNPQQQNNSFKNTNAQPRGNVYRDNAPRQASQPARTYAQPGTRIQSYSSPSYAKPRSSQEYTTPKYRDMRNNQNYSQPQQRSGSNPNRRDDGVIRESAPRKSSNSNAYERQPSQSTYTAPSRSSENSYSAPSRSSNSSNSSSEPSRSSSGSSSGSRNGRR
jgi:hypothetical protein